MTPSKPISLLAGAAVVPLTALALAAPAGTASAATTEPTVNGQPATVSVAKPTVGVRSTSLGKVLVDARGHTLYLFKKDSGTKSACFGACATAWPPLRATGKPTVAGGAKASMVATTKRSDGKPQVTYHGHPLYRFKGDSKPGDVKGQGLNAFGAHWYAVSPTGKQITRRPSTSGSGTTY
jgi:predicted lipoprotein with Yx(FWY)xxD motif